MTGEVQPQTCTTVTFCCTVLCIFQVQLKNYCHLKSTKPVACKSEVVGQNMGVAYFWVWHIRGCGVFMGVSGCDCGNVRNVCFLFQSYLNSHVPRCYIVKHEIDNWWRMAPLQTLHYTPFCSYFKWKRDLWLVKTCILWLLGYGPVELWHNTPFCTYFKCNSKLCPPEVNQVTSGKTWK